MKIYRKREKVFKNMIIPPDDVKAVSKEPTGDAFHEPSCVYNHQHHAVGSVIKNKDGSESVCEEDGSWTN